MSIEPGTLMLMGERAPHFVLGLSIDNEERLSCGEPTPAFRPSAEFAAALQIAGWRGVVRKMIGQQ